MAAGPLADQIFEPAMRPGGNLARIFGSLVGTEKGSGMAVIYIGSSLMMIVIGLAGYLLPVVLNVERITPDFIVASPQKSTMPAIEPILAEL